MHNIPIIIVGVGNVGRALLGQVLTRASRDITVVGLADKNAMAFDRSGLDQVALRRVADGELRLGYFPNARPCRSWEELTTACLMLGLTDMTVLDLTAEQSAMAHLAWLRAGWKVVTANKKPLTDVQAMFDALMAASGGSRYRFTTACGGGLPVIPALSRCLDAGDELIEIRMAASGTLGFIFSRCEQGDSFAEAVLEAKRLGYTEPDPRDDLSGIDVARKALILGRLAGLRGDLSDLRVDSLVPPALRTRSLDNFYDDLDVATSAIDAWLAQARSQGLTLRYLARISAEGIRVGVEEVALGSSFGSLAGPENLFVIRTKQYDAVPLAIRGPGAGAGVTAAGVLADVCVVAGVRATQVH